MDNEKNLKLKVVNSLISGGIAGLFVETLLFPLDALKTKIQHRSYSKNKIFFNNRDYYGHIYSGLEYSAFGSMISSSIFFASFHLLNNYYPDEKNNSLKTINISLISEVLSSLFKVPFEFIKQNLQVRSILLTSHACSNYLLFKQSFNTNKIFASLLRDIPFSVIQFTLWEKLNRIRNRIFDDEYKFRDLLSGIFGGISSGIAAFITSPADNVKTFIYTEKKARNLNISVLRATKTIYLLNGIKSFYVGSFLRTMWLTLGGVMYFGCYQFSNSTLERIFCRPEPNNKLKPVILSVK